MRALLPPQTTIHGPGSSRELLLNARGNILSVTLNITRTAEQLGLDLCIRGSYDGTRWESPLMKLPRQFYCGTWRTVLDLADHQDIRRLRADRQVSRWGKGDGEPVFTIELVVQEL